MPEGHTLHRLARLHQRKFGRAPVIVSSPQGRFADGAAAVNGRVLKKASAWGKHLFHHYEGGRVVHVHLGLYGKFSEVELPMPLPVGQVRMRMVGADFGSDLRGPTVCELIDQAEVVIRQTIHIQRLIHNAVEPRSAASQLFRTGDRIEGANRQAIANLKELREVAKRSGALVLKIRRGNAVVLVPLRAP